MANTCREAVEEVFKEHPGTLTKKDVVDYIYQRYPDKPWKPNTIGDHLIGLSVNHPSGKHFPGLQKHAFLIYLGNGQYQLHQIQEGSVQIAQKGAVKSSSVEMIDETGEEDSYDSQSKHSPVKDVNERLWMGTVLKIINSELSRQGIQNLVASQGTKLPYAFEILSYVENSPATRYHIAYETDILIYEILRDKEWKPRIVIEGKLGSVTTHDAITYSQKALTHKNVHPYLRYGILLGNRKHYPLPGRLFRHGAYFDFMLSWKEFDPANTELEFLTSLITEEVEASRNLDEILFNSRNPNRARYTLLHRPLKLK